MNNLALLLSDQGKNDEAEPLYREALAGRQLALGADHTHTRGSAAGLEALLRDKAASTT